MQKKVLAILLAALFLMASLPNTVVAAQPIKVFIDDEQLRFDVRPVMENNRVLVPLRAIFEPLGAVVDYDTAANTVIATKGQTRISLQTFAALGYRNGEAVPLDVPARVIQGRTMVPLRFVSEALGAGVYWDAESRTVQINPQGGTNSEATETSDIANTIAWEFIRNDIAHYESIGEVKIIDSKITKLDLVGKFNRAADTPIYVYALEYRLLPGDLSKVVMAGGMQVDEDGWLLETCSMGSPLLVISRQNGESTLIGTLWTGSIAEEGGDLEASLNNLLARN